MAVDHFALQFFFGYVSAAIFNTNSCNEMEESGTFTTESRNAHTFKLKNKKAAEILYHRFVHRVDYVFGRHAYFQREYF